MPLPRSGQRRHKKWKSKFVAETISARITQVLDEADERAEEGLITYANLDLQLNPILDKHGIAGPDRAKYKAFGRKLLKASLRTSGRAVDVVALGLKSYFVTSYGCDPSVVDEIISAVLGYVPTY